MILQSDAANKENTMVIQLERLKQTLLELSEFGKQSNGGVTRISYSEEYEQAVD